MKSMRSGMSMPRFAASSLKTLIWSLLPSTRPIHCRQAGVAAVDLGEDAPLDGTAQVETMSQE